MILHHYTCHEHLPKILAEGLSKGDVPTSATDGKNGVWFTTWNKPEGHGVGRGGVLTPVEISYYRTQGRIISDGARFPNKEAIRITVMIPSSDRKLVTWTKWGRKHCEPRFFNALNRKGHNWRTWYIYFGVIPSARFKSIDVLEVQSTAP